jgi:hypothetical protein
MAGRLAQHLVLKGLISDAVAKEALQRAEASDCSLDTALLEEGLVPESELLSAAAELSGLRPVNLSNFEPNPDVAAVLPPKIAERHRLAPLSLDDKTLHIACCYPPPQVELAEIAFLLERELSVWVALELRVREWTSALYGTPLPPRFSTLLAKVDGKPLAPSPEEMTLEAAPHEEVTLEESLPLQVEENEGPEAPVLLENRRAESAERPPPLLPSPAAPPAPPPPPSAPAMPAGDKWTLTEAREALRQASANRDHLIQVVLTYAVQTFEYAAAFACLRGSAVGWDARGRGLGRPSLTEVSISLDAPSVFHTVSASRGSYMGPIPTDAGSAQAIRQLGRAPRAVFLYPIEVRGKLLAIIYADRGESPVQQLKLSEFILFCQDLPSCFEALIAARKKADRPSVEAPAPPRGTNGVPSRNGAQLGSGARPVAPPPLPPPAAPMDVPAGTESPSKAEVRQLEVWVEKLSSSDASERAFAFSQLQQSPEAASRVLVQAFPGPTAWYRFPVAQLPSADELGPVPAALSRLSGAAARALAPLLSAPDVDVRYFALLTAGSLPFPELLDGVFRGAFDIEPDLSSAGRAALTSFKGVPGFDAALARLRQEMSAKTPMRRSLAARALGALHDRASVEALIQMTGSSDGLEAQAASEALRETTRANFGVKPQDWAEWWQSNRARRRAEWLVAALRHPELEIRQSSIEELAGGLRDSLGYHPEGRAEDREAAVQRWEAFLVQPGPGASFEI